MARIKALLIPALLALGVAAAHAVFWLPDPDLLRRLSREDGPFETAGAAALLLAAIVAFIAWRRDTEGNAFGPLQTRRNIFFLLLALLFLFSAGEEISWGQRLLGLRTPGWLASVNNQGETNLHNLFKATSRRFNPSFFSSLFWFTYFLAIPMGARLSRRLRRRLAEINLPIGPIWAGLLMAFNHGLSRLAQARADALWPGRRLGFGAVEVKEAVLEVLFLAAILAVRTRGSSGVPDP